MKVSKRFKCSTCISVVFLLAIVSAHAWAQRPAQGPMSDEVFSAESLGYELVWEDHFDGDALDPEKWQMRGVGPRSLGYVSPEAVSVGDGYLKISALEKDDKFLIGMVGTQNTFMTRYGYFECRAQLQKSPGVWAAFWIQSPDIAKGEDPAVYGAEIDIFEFFKKLGTDIVSHNVHWAYGANPQTTGGMQSYVEGVSEGFHTFALEWTLEKYAFYINGKKYYEVTEGISQIKEYIILSMEIPKTMEELEHTVFPDYFLVDYVKVYQ